MDVVIPCTASKNYPPSLFLRNVAGKSPEERVSKWITLLGGIEKNYTATRLYTYQVKHRPLWYLSAGYGLIPSEARIGSYAATLQRRIGRKGDHPDWIMSKEYHLTGREGSRRWWDALAAWPGPEPGSPRRLAELGRPLLIACGEQYVEVLTEDLLKCDPAITVLITAGLTGRCPPHLVPYLVPVPPSRTPRHFRNRMYLNLLLAANVQSRADVVRVLEKKPSRRFGLGLT